MATISIAIPTWETHGEGVRYIIQLLESIAIQTLPPCEVCISDHSLDRDIRDAVLEYSKLQRFSIRYQHNPDDRGSISANTNAAIAMCTGDIIKIMFQDDVFVTPTALETIESVFSRTTAQWLVVPSTQMSEDGTAFHSPKLPWWNEGLHEGRNTLGSPSAIAFRRDAVEQHYPLFDNSFTFLMDCDGYCKLTSICGFPVILDGIPHVANREHDNQMTRQESSRTGSEVRFEKEKALCKKRWTAMLSTRKQPKPPPQPRRNQPLRGLCINLKRRTDRWEAFQRSRRGNAVIQSFFARTGRFEAVDGKAVAPRLLAAEAGALGCTMSHIGALSYLAKTATDPNEFVMVVEDDIQFTNLTLLQRLTDSFPTMAGSTEWMVFLLAASSAILQPLSPTSRLGKLGMVRAQRAGSTTGYIVRVRYIPEVIRVFQSSAVHLQAGRSRQQAALDVMWLALQREKTFITFGSPLATQRPGHSDIEGRTVDYRPIFAHAERRDQSRAPTDTNPIFYVCSYGGSGSKLLCNYLKGYGKTLHVHSRKPPARIEHLGQEFDVDKGTDYHEWFNGATVPANVAKRVRMIYLYRDPVRATLSRLRNETHRKHVQVADPSHTIEDVVATGKDLFGLEEFYHNYVDGTEDRSYPIICIKYEALFDNLNEINKVLGLPPPETHLERIEKERDETHVPALEQVYAPLKAEMAAMGPIEIR